MFDYSSTARRAGLAAVGTAGLLSALSTCALLCYICYCSITGTRKSPLTVGVRNFVRTELGRYLVALLVSECVQGSAFAMNFYWAGIGAMPESKGCRAQGIISQFGDFGSALFSLAITFHTFSLLFLQRKPAGWVCWMTLILVGLFMIILPILGSTAIPHSQKRGEFWGSTGAWCWVSEHYQVERYLFVYMWIFINLFCSIVLYTLIYLKFRGVIEYDPSKRNGKHFTFHGWNTTRQWAPQGHQSFNSQDESQTSDSRGNPNHVSSGLVKIAQRLMWYPIVYAIVVVPVSICRLGLIAGNWSPPFWLLVFAGVCFSGSGLSNTLLFVFTRHAFIQRMTRPAGIQITTHKLTVTTDADDANVGRLKNRPLDELSAEPTTRPPSDGLRYAVTFSSDDEIKQPDADGYKNSEQNQPKGYGW